MNIPCRWNRDIRGCTPNTGADYSDIAIGEVGEQLQIRPSDLYPFHMHKLLHERDRDDVTCQL